MAVTPTVPRRLIFDVTGLIERATQRPSGIDRLALEIALRLVDSEAPVSFCRFDTESRVFVEVEPTLVRTVCASMRGTDATTSTTTGIGRAMTRRARLGRHGAMRSHTTRAALAIASDVRRLLADVLAATEGLVRDIRQLRGRRRVSICFSDRWSEADTFFAIDLVYSAHDLDALVAQRSRRGFRIATMIHDLIPIVTPHFVSWTDSSRYRAAISIADTLVVNSDATQRDVEALMDREGLARPPMVKLPMGSGLRDLTPTRPEHPSLNGLTSGSFVLSVSTITIRKNVRVLLDVWERLLSEHHPDDVPRLVVAGARGWLSDETMSRLQRTPAFAGRVLHAHGLTDESIAWLYRECAFTVYPSLYEGWGLPVSESNDFGKLCIASDRSSLPEAAEGLSELLDPNDRSAWIESIWRFWSDHDLRHRRETMINEKHRRVTATESAACVLDIAQQASFEQPS